MQLYLQIEASFNIIGPLPWTSVPISLFTSGFPTSFLYGCSFSLCVLRVLPKFFFFFAVTSLGWMNYIYDLYSESAAFEFWSE
jgi:hypothetical protein